MTATEKCYYYVCPTLVLFIGLSARLHTLVCVCVCVCRPVPSFANKLHQHWPLVEREKRARKLNLAKTSDASQVWNSVVVALLYKVHTERPRGLYAQLDSRISKERKKGRINIVAVAPADWKHLNIFDSPPHRTKETGSNGQQQIRQHNGSMVLCMVRRTSSSCFYSFDLLKIRRIQIACDKPSVASHSRPCIQHDRKVVWSNWSTL